MKNGWQTKNLGELCRIRTGKKDVNQGNPEGEFPFFTCAAEHTFSDSYSFDTEALLIAGNGDVGNVSYYKGKFEAYQRTYVLSDFAEVLPRFLYLILDGKLKETVSKQKLGNTMPYIKVGMLTDFQLPVPPLAEQQRIVGVLDEAFAGIATAQANAEKNLQNARALFASHLQSVFTQRGKGWVEKRMDALYKVGSSKRVLKSQWKTEGVPFYRGREVTRLAADGFVDNELFISEEHFAELSKEYGVPKAGDIIITAIGTIGNSHIVRSSDRFYFKDASVLWLKRTAEVSSEFIKYWLKSSVFFDQLDRGNGATVDTLTIQKLQSVELLLPQLEEQKAIAAKLDDLSEETQRLATLYERKLAALAALKKSLLNEAFTGQL